MDKKNAAIGLVLEGTYPTEIGGISTWCHHLITHAPARDFVLIRVGDDLPPEAAWPYKRPRNLRRVQAIKPPVSLHPRVLSRWAASARVDLTGVSALHAVGAGLAGVLAQSSELPWVLNEHASYVRELELGNRFIETGMYIDAADPVALFRGIEVELRRAATCTTCLDASTAAAHRADGSRRTLVIPNGTPAREQVIPPRRDRPRAIYLGRLHPLKGTDLLLDAVRELDPAELELELYGPLQGDRCWRDALARDLERCAHNTTWFGPTREDIFAARTPDILVLASRSEAQPLAIMEAMMAGVAVIAPDVGDIRRMLAIGSERPCGVIFPAGNTDALREALLQLARAPGLRTALARAGRQRALEHYASEAVSARYEALYQELEEAGADLNQAATA